MDIINQNSKEVTFKEFECAYKILNKIKRDNLTVKNAEVVIKTFEICYNFVLKIMEIKIVGVKSVISLPKYLLVTAARYNLINDLEMWMIFYNEKDRLVVNLGNIYKGKLACSIMKILPIFKIKVDKIMKSFEVKNKVIDQYNKESSKNNRCISGIWLNQIVPLPMELIALNINRVKIFIANLNANWISVFINTSLNFKTCFCCGISN